MRAPITLLALNVVWLIGMGIVLGTIWISAPVQAQQKPYQSYAITGGCLYITPQGFAVVHSQEHPCN